MYGLPPPPPPRGGGARLGAGGPPRSPLDADDGYGGRALEADSGYGAPKGLRGGADFGSRLRDGRGESPPSLPRNAEIRSGFNATQVRMMLFRSVHGRPAPKILQKFS